MIASEIASFIASMNSTDGSYVGYCGTDALEIESAIQDFDIPLAEAFFLQKENGKINSLLGFDVDPSKAEAEVWGPFSDQKNWSENSLSLWREAQKSLLAPLKKLNFFFDSKNTKAIAFALSLGAKRQTENSILVLREVRKRTTDQNELAELSAKHKNGFIHLHDSLFPSAYLSGQEIYDLLDKNNKVFVLEKDEEFIGYIYVEANPDHGESTIHFFGVSENYRGKGFGQHLLIAGVGFILGFDEIQEITLCVESQNRHAIRLYERIGFVERNRCIHFVLEK